MGASQYQPSVTPELFALNEMATQKAATARWRCREPSRQLYIGARVLRVPNLKPLHPLQLRDAHPAVLRLPVEVRRTADPMLAGQLAECDSSLAFLQESQ
jgi:hypothetical protein